MNKGLDGTPFVVGFVGNEIVFYYEVWFPVEERSVGDYQLPLEITEELISTGDIIFAYKPRVGLYCFVSFASRTPFHRFRHLTPIR